MICGFTCDDLAAMFKELKTLGVVVRDLSDQLNKVVRRPPLKAFCKREFAQILQGGKRHFVCMYVSLFSYQCLSGVMLDRVRRDNFSLRGKAIEAVESCLF